MRYAVFRSIVSILVLLASVPLAQFAVRSGFTFASALIVPTLMLGIWLSLSSRRRTNRIGWIAFVVVVAIWLPTCPWWTSQIENIIIRIQSVARRSVYLSVYSVVEVSGVFAMFLLPWSVACVSGTFAAVLAKRALRRRNVDDGPQGHCGFRFTLREMLFAVAIFAALTVWLSRPMHQWRSQKIKNQSRFLALFEDSFTSGKVALLAEPEITEVYRPFIRGGLNESGTHEYRIVAPIRKDKQTLWAVWSYTCDERYVGTVSKFAYAETPTQGGLPPDPFPLTQYLSEPIGEMIDGEPQQSWPKAEIVRASKSIKPGETITVIANVRWGTQCELVVHPFHAVSSPHPLKIAPESGRVRWQWTLDPKFKGDQIAFEIHARIAPLYRATSVSGTIDIERDEPE